jgi:ribosomal protein L24
MNVDDEVIVKRGILAGVRAKVIRVSNRTGALSLELLGTRGVWQKGETLQMMPYELDLAKDLVELNVAHSDPMAETIRNRLPQIQTGIEVEEQEREVAGG